MTRKRYNAEATQPLQVNSMATSFGGITWYKTVAGDFRISTTEAGHTELRHYTNNNTTHYKTFTTLTRPAAIEIIEVETKAVASKAAE